MKNFAASLKGAVQPFFENPSSQRAKEKQLDQLLHVVGRLLLFIGAFFSLGFVSTQSYELFEGLFSRTTAIVLTVVVCVLYMFAFDLFLGVLAPRCAEDLAAGEQGAKRNGYTLAANLLMWGLTIGIASTSISFSMLGSTATSSVSVEEDKGSERISEATTSRDEVQKEILKTITKDLEDAKQSDKQRKAELLASAKAKIAAAKEKGISLYGNKDGWYATKRQRLLDKAKKDSAALVDSFVPEAPKLRQKKLDLMESQVSLSNNAIQTLREEDMEEDDDRDKKKAAVALLIRYVGGGVTILYLLVVLIRALLVVGREKPVTNKKVHSVKPSHSYSSGK